MSTLVRRQEQQGLPVTSLCPARYDFPDHGSRPARLRSCRIDHQVSKARPIHDIDVSLGYVSRCCYSYIAPHGRYIGMRETGPSNTQLLTLIPETTAVLSEFASRRNQVDEAPTKKAELFVLGVHASRGLTHSHSKDRPDASSHPSYSLKTHDNPEVKCI